MIGDMFSGEWRMEGRTGYHRRRFGGAMAAWDVMAAVPPGTVPADGAALLLLTDGALHFDAAAAAAAALARRPEKTGVGPTIVVGIASGPDWSHDADRRRDSLLPGGDAAEDLQSVVRDVVTAVAELGRVDPALRAIFGHSFGGLFALQMLAVAPGLFETAIAVSPSFWRAPTLPDAVAAVIGHDTRILLASGEREEAINADLPRAQAALARSGARVSRRTYPDEDHGSVAFTALPAALRFLHRSR